MALAALFAGCGGDDGANEEDNSRFYGTYSVLTVNFENNMPSSSNQAVVAIGGNLEFRGSSGYFYLPGTGTAFTNTDVARDGQSVTATTTVSGRTITHRLDGREPSGEVWHSVDVVEFSVDYNRATSTIVVNRGERPSTSTSTFVRIQ